MKYTSDHYAGVKFGALYGFSNAANFADNRARRRMRGARIRDRQKRRDVRLPAALALCAARHR
ncbi:porin [Burkholderia pseudomallei]|nr:porin [Burkholderia pseudomallei]